MNFEKGEDLILVGIDASGIRGLAGSRGVAPGREYQAIPPREFLAVTIAESFVIICSSLSFTI
jgi:hypothetical protein